MQHRNLQLHQVVNTRPLSILGRGFLVFVLLLTGFIPQFTDFKVVNFDNGLSVAKAASTTLAISQFQVAGVNSADEFVEIHNVGTSAIDLNGYKLVYRSATGTTDVSVVTWNASTVVQPGKFYLVVAGLAGNPLQGYDDPVAGDITFTHSGTGLFSGTSGGLALRDTGNNIVDSVGYGGATNAFVETATTTVPAANASKARNNNGCADTDNNSNDFGLVNPATPRNSATAAVMCGVVEPALNVSPGGLNFSAIQGGANPASQNVTVTSVPGPISYTVAVNSAGWLAASSSAGQTPDSLTVTATTGALTPGQYNGVITLTGVLTPTIVKTVPVVFTVNSNVPMLIVNPGNLNFSAIVNGSNPAAQMVNVTSAVGNPNFTVAVDSSGWLNATPANGTAPAVVTVTATTGSLAVGSYNGVVTLTNTTTPTDIKTIPVTFTISATPTYTPINQIQKTTGQAGQWKSQLNGQVVTTEGVVTAKVSNGFWIQEPNPDNDLNTSEGVFVFTTNAANLGNAVVGHRVRVGGTITEFKQSTPSACADTNKPTITEIGTVSAVTDLGVVTPIAPTVVSYNRTGPNIRQIPTQSIYTTPAPNQETDGIDFWESLEGMYVQVDDALVVGPTDTNGSSYHTLVVLADNGLGATILNNRKGIPLQPTDFNPERLQVLLPVAGPFVSSGDKFTVPLVGNIDIDCFTSPTLKLAGATPTAANIDTSGRPARETNPALTNANHLRVVAFNVENLDPGDPQAKFDLLGSQIINNLGAPDIISLSEVQDNNGATDNGVVNSDTTLNKLVQSVFAASGNTITYSYVYIEPIDGTNGGEPGGNIRPVLFYRTDRGVSFTARPGGNATTANEVLPDGSLKFNPGLITPTNTAFNSSRKPLAGEFVFKGQKIIVVANHWNSKGGDSGTYSVVQPPVLGSETQRLAQATVVRNFVNNIQAANPNAYVILNGDFNDFEFSPPLNLVKTGPTAAGNLLDGNETIPLSEDRYTYRYEGNAQSLDHALYTQALSGRLINVNATHINADYATNDPLRSSDHDPIVVNFDFTPGGTPDLTISKSHTGNFTVGVPATYTIMITNTGSAAATGQITVTDILPVGMIGSGWNPPAGWGCTNDGSQTSSCTVTTTLAPNNNLTLTLTITPTVAGTFTNTAMVSGGGESNTTNNTAQDLTVVNGAPCTVNVVTMISDNGQATVCGTFSYAIANTAANGTVTFQLSSGNAVTFTGSLTPTVKAGLTISGGVNGVQLVGNGVAGNGLVLGGNNTLQDLTVRGFAGRQLVATTGANKIFRSKFYD